MEKFKSHYLEVYDKDFLKQCGLTSHSTFDEVKDKMLWGTYGKPANIDNFKWVKLKDCSENHLKAIILQPHIPELTRIIIKDILKDKYEEKIENLRYTRWRRKDYDPNKEVCNGYTVVTVTNTAHRHPAHPEQVLYKGDNGNIWSMPLTDWPGNLIPE